MPIITDQGIFTKELCENSKKYLSRLLIGKTGINPDLLSWNLLLTEKFRLDHFIETGNEDLTQLQEARAEWNLALKEVKLQSHIQDKLIEIESLHAKDYLKVYDPEFKKQQADLRSRKLAWVSIPVIIGLVTAFAVPFALGLLGSLAALVGVVCLVSAISLTFYSMMSFFGETLIDHEWIKVYEIEKEKCQLKLSALKGSFETEVRHEEIAMQSHHSTRLLQQTLKVTLPNEPSVNSVATQTAPANEQVIVIHSFCFFKIPIENADTLHLQSLNSFANKSC